MAKTNYQTIDDYHKGFSGEPLTRMQTIRKIIKEVVPEAEENISYQIPSFKYKGRHLIYYAAFPNHISISHPYSPEFWEYFKADLKGYKTSKAVVQLPADKALPEALIRKIIAFRKKENEEKKK